jgi:predicted metal-dependent peptidase
VPVFDWLQREGRRPDALLWFTDADGEFPAQVPDYPVIWLVKGARPVPFGQRVALN